MATVKQILINPFEDSRDQTLLGVGLIAYVLSSVQVYGFGYVPDGVFQAHLATDLRWYSGFVNGAINILAPAVVLYGFGKIIYTKTRFFDVLNVVMIAQIVNYFIAFLLLNPLAKSILVQMTQAIEGGDIMLRTVAATDIAVLSVGGILAFLLLIYFFYLLVIGMKIAIHSKKAVHVILMILLVVAVDTALHLINPYV